MAMGDGGGSGGGRLVSIGQEGRRCLTAVLA